MCQVRTGAYVSLTAPEKIDYTGCHQEKTTTHILHVVPITTHTHVRFKSIGNKNKDERTERTDKKIKESEKGKEGHKIKENKRQDKTRRGSKEREGRKTPY